MRFLLLVPLLLALLAAVSAAAGPAAPMRLRGGGIMSTIAESLGWKREKTGTQELGCGPLPQAKAKSRHTDKGKKMKKKHDGDAMTRSHSFTIPDIAGQRRVTAHTVALPLSDATLSVAAARGGEGHFLPSIPCRSYGRHRGEAGCRGPRWATAGKEEGRSNFPGGDATGVGRGGSMTALTPRRRPAARVWRRMAVFEGPVPWTGGVFVGMVCFLKFSGAPPFACLRSTAGGRASPPHQKELCSGGG
eukprot:CAMPEP_0174923498 /NCGR_PEP_ID=MMETSP1355-20121228/6626_1 /TAXON_ID=464990 /ORGANISM="Hemiselmis tepida, Strain CCMP443" /LENGTH=246 /DNA_ID=CAMNT_0016169189 /DNA_START=18 /DNA_END=755 /DNA_ORIENTATION=-